jgi:hypothetical protein
MLTKYFQDIKAVWKPATIMYLLGIGISILTGWSIEIVLSYIFMLIFVLILGWSAYVYLKKFIK